MTVRYTRREALGVLAGTAAAVAVPLRAEGKYALSTEEEAFLDDMQRRACLYFTEQVGAGSGQVLDRAAANNMDGERDPRRMASIAATGFGLTALCIGDKRGFVTHEAARAQVLRTLRFHAEQMPAEHGFFCHFNDVDTGKPWPNVEWSSIDTALLLCGVLTARAHFANDPEIKRLATLIYERVDWPWMLNGGTEFSMGWKSKTGFLDARWNHYCELMMIPLLAMGSPTHPVGPEVWSAWSRPKITFDGLTYISGNDPLFTHQYSQAWFDFRHRHDAYANYFDNSVTATKAHKAFCLQPGRAIQRGLLGHFGIGFAGRLPGVGRAAEAGRHRRQRGAVRDGGIAAVFACRVFARAAIVEGAVRGEGVGPIRLLRRPAPASELV